MRKIISVANTELVLLPERVLYWPEQQLIALADWHLGKAAHFRKEGIALPQPNLQREFTQLSSLFFYLEIQTVVLLGDVFHSAMNSDWELFRQFVSEYSELNWVVTLGNHDIVGATAFEECGVRAVEEWELDSIHFQHMAPKQPLEGHWYVVGHLHPGCTLRLSLGQPLRVPCFMLEQQVITLPAFGELTGLAIQQPTSSRQLYPIVGEAVKWLKKA